jgi:hypothetical protein
MDKHGWPVAGEQAYPLAIKSTPAGGDAEIPSASELAWLTATVRVIPDFVLRHLHADHGAPQPAQAIYALSGVHGGQNILLRYPAQEQLTPQDEKMINSLGVQMESPQDEEHIEGDRVGQELEEFIRDWYYDKPSHEFARQLGAFLFQFLDYLESTGLSRQTLRKHSGNCWCIGKFECDYGDHNTFSPAIFLGGPKYLYEFKRKVSDSKDAVNSYTATWRKLERYVQLH